MYDTNNLDSTYCCETPPEQQWVEQFQTQTLALFQQLPSSRATIFSSTCLVHCLSCNADFWLFTVDGASLAQQVGAWFFQGQSAPLVSSCTGWDCTLQCSGGPWEPTNQQCKTTTNQCANDYMITQAAPVSNQQSQAAMAAGSAAWAAHQKAQQGGGSYENSDWAATKVLPAVSASTSPAAAAQGPAGTVSATEPALAQAQLQQLQGLTQQQ